MHVCILWLARKKFSVQKVEEKTGKLKDTYARLRIETETDGAFLQTHLFKAIETQRQKQTVIVRHRRRRTETGRQTER